MRVVAVAALASVAAAAAERALGAGVGQRPDPCAVTVALGPVGPEVQVLRRGAPLAQPTLLRSGDVVRVAGRGRLRLGWGANRYVLKSAAASLRCESLVVRRGRAPARTLVLQLNAGALTVQSGPPSVAVVTPEALIVAPDGRTTFFVQRGSRGGARAETRDRPIAIAAVDTQRLRLTVRPHQTGLIDTTGVRLDTYPFAISPQQRPARGGDGLLEFWGDGRPCSTGCRAPGAISGWPLKPFRRQHALRAGLNELRPANFHVGIDIQARDRQQVYALTSGTAHVIAASGPDERVQVGPFVYWHVYHEVGEGAFVRADRTPVGSVKRGFGHLHLSELAGSTYLNPLRPGGRVLSPWSDTEPPVIGPPRNEPTGRVIVDAFDPQSFVTLTTYETPVLAPAALAWRLFDASGRQLGPLEWALRGSQHLADNLRATVYAPGATNPGFACFERRRVCRPTWRYRLAGGLTPPVPLGALGPGRYRLTVYAWDWAANVSARDLWFRRSAVAHRASIAKDFGPLLAAPDVQ
jgi:hypothetical protein